MYVRKRLTPDRSCRVILCHREINPLARVGLARLISFFTGGGEKRHMAD